MTDVPPIHRARPAAGWLFAAWMLLLLLLAAARPLSVPDEGRYAEVGRWMLVSGDWLAPRLNGLPFFHKPPLTHWLQAVSMAVFGATPWAARLPGVLLAGLMLAGLYVAARRLADEAVARRAAIMLGASGGLLIGGQYVNHDMGVATWIASAIWCFALAFTDGERPHAGWARAGFAACALGLLTKGLIGVVLPGLVLFVWITWTRRWRQVPRLPWISGLLLFLAIAGPWFWLAAQRYPDMLGYLFGVHQFSRYTGNTFNNPQPLWFYPVGLLALLLPWALFALADGVGRWRERRAARTPDDALALLCWIWLGAIVLFFSIPRSKLIGYMLPVLPPLAVLAALGWQRLMGGRRSERGWFALVAVIAVAIPVALTLTLPSIQRSKLTDDVAPEWACLARPGDVVYVTGGYPFDFSFVAQLPAPMVVARDWPKERAETDDAWPRQLFEAGDFEPAAAARLLRTPEVLDAASRAPGAWLLARRPLDQDTPPIGPAWRPVLQGHAWALYASAAERPEAAEHERLPGCHDHRRAERQP